MFDFVSRVARAATDVVTLPVALVADVATLGGLVTDRDEPYTATKAKRLANDAVDAVKAVVD